MCFISFKCRPYRTNRTGKRNKHFQQVEEMDCTEEIELTKQVEWKR